MSFTNDTEDEPERDHRWRRRDTPHYRKNQRVNKEDDSEHTVQQILAEAAAQKEAAAIATNLQVGDWMEILG